MTNKVTLGLYRHFKGGYYYVTGLTTSAIDEKTILVNYFDVCHPEYGSFSRPIDDFVSEIGDREDNKTGQIVRFERVKDLNFQLGSISTEQLIEELRSREDSPIHELDIEQLRSNVFCKDYIVGDRCEDTEDYPRGVHTMASFDSLDKARNYLDRHQFKKSIRIFKRVFIET